MGLLHKILREELSVAALERRLTISINLIRDSKFSNILVAVGIGEIVEKSLFLGGLRLWSGRIALLISWDGTTSIGAILSYHWIV